MKSPRHICVRLLERFVKPLVPTRRRLAFGYWIAQFGGCEAELKYLNRLGPNRGVAIDAGANEGMYTFRLSRLYNEVVAFEIHPELATRLKLSAPTNAVVHPIGLSAKSATCTLRTPVSRGVRLDGWASLERGNFPDAERFIETTVEVRPLDSFDIRGVTFVKCDVEGHELQLLEGARETLIRDRPIVLIEVKEQNRSQVSAFFQELRYHEKRLEDFVGVADTPENLIYVPALK